MARKDSVVVPLDNAQFWRGGRERTGETDHQWHLAHRAQAGGAEVRRGPGGPEHPGAAGTATIEGVEPRDEFRGGVFGERAQEGGAVGIGSG